MLLRGAVFLMGANLVYVVVAYAIQTGMGRMLGPEAFGTWGVVLALVTIVQLVATTGFPQSFARAIAANDKAFRDIAASSLRFELVVICVLTTLYLAAAALLARWLGDASLVFHIRVSAIIIPTYALITTFDYYLNGLREFRREAIVQTTGSVARLGLVFGLVAMGFGVTGGFIGYGIGSLAGWLVAWRFLGRFRQPQQPYPWRDFIAFGLPATLFSVCIFLVQSLDLFAVKSLLQDDAQAGYYTSAATIARTPFFLFLGVAGVLMPSLAKARASKDAEFIRSSLADSLRYMLLLLVPLVLLVSATSTQLVVLLFSQTYEPAGEALQVLILGLGALSLFMALAYAIMGAFGALVPLAILAPIVVLDGALNVLLVPRIGITGAATATAVSACLATVLAGWFLLWRVGGILRPWSLVRIGMASGIVYALGYLLPDSPALLVPGYIGIGIAYLGVLVLLRELRGEDVGFALRALGLQREEHAAAGHNGAPNE